MAKKRTQVNRRPVQGARPGAPRSGMQPGRYSPSAASRRGMPPGRYPPQRARATAIPVKRNRRREKEYFYIMRRGVTFFIMVVAAIWLAVLVLSFLKIMPAFTSFVVEPDRTPLSLREDIETGENDEDGNPIVEKYEDQTVYICVDDLLYGSLTKLGTQLKIDKLVEFTSVDADGNSKSPYYDNIMTNVNEVKADAERVKKDSMFAIAAPVVTYYPIALIVGALIALIVFLFALLSLFGRRIYKGFVIMSIIVLVVGIASLVAGMAMSGIRQGNPQEDKNGDVVSVINFAKVSDYLFGSFAGVPEEEVDLIDAEEGEEVVSDDLDAVAGISCLALTALPLVMIALSLFTKKKIPYSIFDR